MSGDLIVPSSSAGWRRRGDSQVVAPYDRAAEASLHRPRDSSTLQTVETPGNSPIPAAHTHDGFFKAVFSQPEQATAFFKSHLPPEIVVRIDWPSLVVLPGSFIKSSLQQVHADLLFSVRMGGRGTLLYLLFEHQSSPDPAMPLRLLGYVMEILTQHHKAHGFPLPPVLPLVLHQGPDAWNVSTAFEDLFELPEDLAPALQPFLPQFHHALLDLTRFDPAAEEADTRLRVVLQLMKLARQKELAVHRRSRGRGTRCHSLHPHRILPQPRTGPLRLAARRPHPPAHHGCQPDPRAHPRRLRQSRPHRQAPGRLNPSCGVNSKTTAPRAPLTLA